jgi:uncharacterized membrane protein
MAFHEIMGLWGDMNMDEIDVFFACVIIILLIVGIFMLVCGLQLSERINICKQHNYFGLIEYNNINTICYDYINETKVFYKIPNT